MRREEPGDFQPPIMMSGEGQVVPGQSWRWFELSPSQHVNNLHMFTIEKEAQRKRRMFNLKYNIKSCMF
jgi:hypothetical protein